MPKYLFTILFLIFFNILMTFAWYGHLKFSAWKTFDKLNLLGIIAMSWAIAFLEYCFLIPRNKIGYEENEGAHSYN